LDRYPVTDLGDFTEHLLWSKSVYPIANIFLDYSPASPSTDRSLTNIPLVGIPASLAIGSAPLYLFLKDKRLTLTDLVRYT
jgi:hypothetical protein